MPKRDLYFRAPIINAAGMLGFAPDLREFQKTGVSERSDFSWANFGAFVTNPLSWRPRKPTGIPAVVEYPGGFLLHTGLPNPGFGAARKKYARQWADAPLPIIVHLMADRPEETRRMVESLEEIENVMAAELGFAPLLTDDIILTAIEMSLGELPLIVSLPMEDAARLAPRVMAAGAAAVSLSAPRGSVFLSESGGIIHGRLYGPSLFPQGLEIVSRIARAGAPIIGGVGVYTRAQVGVMQEAGAMAVPLDAVLWRGGFS
ncbi:MAG: Dihydroorotate dehydrogenase [Anaerolineales bacterium]|nr:Dihydroorotate dehydrogenase [Anaerolineales bacterium]